MSRLEVRPIAEGDREAIAMLLQSRHTLDTERIAGLSGLFTRAEPCRVATGMQMDNPLASGVVATRDGRVVGYLSGERMLFAPNDYPSRFIEPHSITISVLGHAVADGEDQVAAYRALYSALAADWVKQGFFTHTTHITPGDRDLEEAWVALGFGRKITAAVRPTHDPVEGVRHVDRLDIHQAGPEDVEVVLRLSEVLDAHHAGAPMFWPIVRTADRAAHEAMAAALQDPRNAHFVAYDGGRPLGMQTFMVPGFTPPTVHEDGKTVYLFEGVVDDGLRGGGVGTALLDHSMRWCREQGYERCCLHYASGNPSGAPFWQGHGFTPVEYTMQRRVDERIAWANA